jgi:hypothetical protein
MRNTTFGTGPGCILFPEPDPFSHGFNTMEVFLGHAMISAIQILVYAAFVYAAAFVAIRVSVAIQAFGDFAIVAPVLW